MKHRHVAVCAVVALAGLSAAGWLRHTMGRVRVEIVSVRARPAGPERPDRRAGTEPLEGGKLIADLDREIHLTDQQRTDLARALRQLAAMQARLDLHDDPDERGEMQEKLAHQLIVRLRRILGEDKARSIAAVIAEKQPRILYAASVD
jgi:hypothetical protein